MRKFIVVIICVCLFLCGCGNVEVKSSGKEVNIQNTKPLMSRNGVQGVAYEFRTAGGEYITVIQNTVDDVTYKVPTEVLDARVDSTPIQIRNGDYVIDIGYANQGIGDEVNANVYGTIYGEVVNTYLQSTEDISDELKSLLMNYTHAYPNNAYRSTKGFAGRDVNDTIWSDSVVDLTDYSLIKKFNFPIVTCSIKLDSGEYLVAHCYATLQSGYWELDNIPAYLDVATNRDYINVTQDDYIQYITVMKDAYNRCCKFMSTELDNIHIGDLSNQYTIVSLSNTTSENYTYGVDVSEYDKYAFVVLKDSSVYMCYENNGIRAYECIAGDATHDLTPSWEEDNTKLVDNSSGDSYDFTWKVSE